MLSHTLWLLDNPSPQFEKEQYHICTRRNKKHRHGELSWFIWRTKMATPFISLFFISLIAVVLFCFEFNVVAQSENVHISLGVSFRGNESIQSQNGLFQLGFFSPSGSNARYLGIWYAKRRPQTVVWVANRNQPAFDNPSLLLSVYGELMVINFDKSVLWSSGTKGMNVFTAVLMNTGNLVLISRNSSVIWESFGHPTDVWLPSMVMRLGMRLTSWKTKSNPAEGPFSLAVLETEEVILTWNGRQYWTSGVWNGRIFGNHYEMTKTYLFNFSVDLKSGFTWSVYRNVSAVSISKFVLDINGVFKLNTWATTLNGWTSYWAQPTDTCDVYGICGPYGLCNSTSSDSCSCPDGFEAANPEAWRSQGYSDGCKQKMPLICSAESRGGKFLSLDRASFDTQGFSHTLPDYSESQCMSACLQNCSCVAYHYDEIAKNCSLVSEVLWSSSAVSSGAMKLRVSAKQGSRPKRHKTARIGITVGVIVGCALVILIIFGALFLRRKGSRARDSHSYVPGVLHWFSYKQLQSATHNFKDNIGSGGFGAVYKGILPDNTPVAVKKLQQSDQSEQQFRTEVRTIGTIQHVNLVRLLGFCSERSNRLLVLEYMPNGSLDQVLFSRRQGSSTGVVLGWNARFQIAVGAARAIAYLHEECRDCIIHCDVKPGNILLDANYGAKVSDFGLAKLVGREFSRVLTSIRGTRGYLAPEWMTGLAITAKADVYSFGMTLLEIISGRRNIEADEMGRGKHFFPVWAATQIRNGGDVACLADERLEGKVEEEEVRRAAYTAVWCIQDDEEMRPKMSKVVQLLEGSVEVTPPPLPTSLCTYVNVDSNGASIL